MSALTGLSASTGKGSTESLTWPSSHVNSAKMSKSGRDIQALHPTGHSKVALSHDAATSERPTVHVAQTHFAAIVTKSKRCIVRCKSF